MNPDLYTKCVSCGRPILHRTAAKGDGRCAHCPDPKFVRVYEPPPPERFDPLDSDPDRRWLVEIIDAAAEREAIDRLNEAFPRDEPRVSLPFGAVHLFWDCKKRILRESYGIDWKSPKELNPHIWYD
jgi:hypothetical protein